VKDTFNNKYLNYVIFYLQWTVDKYGFPI